ncbi:MAG TPA: nuclear transport factor 2 family protein [Baekduia sp.]|nr:nuclear transport factor 2 family protein [Baekduia sp.]
MGHLLDLVRAYYAACNAADADRLRACFTADAAHYFTRLPPLHGDVALAGAFAATQRRLDARWTVEHGLEAGDEAVSEWTMAWTHPASGRRRLDRGTEWFAFTGDRIREIRAYHHSDAANRSGDLLGFDHAGRGHTVLAS